MTQSLLCALCDLLFGSESPALHVRRSVVSRYAWSSLLVVSTGVFSWLAMMAVHEAGHVLHAVVSGGRVERVVLHPLAISRTDVHPNPHPLFVAWGGAAWGCLIPAAAWLAARLARLRVEYVFRFFAGFCLIANGAYLGTGVVFPAGDAADLLRHGTPAWLLGAFGMTAMGLGLWSWHGLGRHFGLDRDRTAMDRRDALGMLAASVALAAAELLLG